MCNLSSTINKNNKSTQTKRSLHALTLAGALANPLNNDDPNCTEFTLDMLNVSSYSRLEISQLKVNAKAHFMPQRLLINRFTVFLGAALTDNITTQDHSGRAHTAAFTSIHKKTADRIL